MVMESQRIAIAGKIGEVAKPSSIDCITFPLIHSEGSITVQVNSFFRDDWFRFTPNQPVKCYGNITPDGILKVSGLILYPRGYKVL